MSERKIAFYSLTGRDFFPGLVGLLNSLRLTGHTAPLYVLDCGMERHQHERLEPHATIVPARAGVPPSLLKLTSHSSTPRGPWSCSMPTSSSPIP
jgi:hypothetical protein